MQIRLKAFTMTILQNDPCDAGTNSRNGTCYTAGECTSKGKVTMMTKQKLILCTNLGIKRLSLP